MLLQIEFVRETGNVIATLRDDLVFGLKSSDGNSVSQQKDKIPPEK